MKNQSKIYDVGAAPKINQNGAQERSESEIGSMSSKEPKGRDETKEFLAPLMRFWVPFCSQSGAKGIPKIKHYGTRKHQKSDK